MTHRAFPLFAIILSAPATVAELPPEREAAILEKVHAAEGFETSLFAALPGRGKPAFVSAAPNGDLYVSFEGNDESGSAPSHGSVIRLRDTDGDGKADEVTEFVPKVESPRGLLWDHDRLYLVHPPHLSAFPDKDGDGIAEEPQILVEDLSAGFHGRAPNGISLGLDGWLYLSGSGIVRVRPDGSGLETYATGTHNLMEAAISPEMEMFARDSTGDGGHWKTGLHHFTGSGDHGYPRMYRNFPEEAVPPVAHYDDGGDGMGGSVYIDEPGFEEWNNAPFTVDAGTLWKHTLKPKGPTFRETWEPEKFIGLPHPADADVDAMSRVHLAGWLPADADNPGTAFIVRVSPAGFTPEALPDFAAASPAELATLLESDSHRRRLEAQRELIRRGLPDETIPALVSLIGDPEKNIAARAAALFLFLHFPEKSSPVFSAIAELAADPSFDVLAARAAAEMAEPLAAERRGEFPVPKSWRNQPATLIQLSRLVSNSPGWNLKTRRAIFDLTLGNSDPLVRHAAIQALAKTGDHEFALSYTGDPEERIRSEEAEEFEKANLPRHDPDGRGRPDALAALARMHKPETVDGLIRQLEKAHGLPQRAGHLAALCRLHSRKSGSDDPEPWSETQKIAGVLRELLVSSPADEASHLAEEMKRHGIPLESSRESENPE